jgi:DNA topoisomerase-2
MIIDGDLVISKKKKPVLVAELKKHGFKAFPKVIDAVKAGEDAPVVEEEEEESGNDETEILSSAYDYLLGMPLWSLTHERVEKLRRQIGEKEVEMDALIKLSKEDIWKRDLDDFINEWRFQLEDEARRQRKVANMGRRTSAKLMTATGRGKATKKRKAALDDDSDDEDFAAPKSKKSAAAKKTEPKGGLLSYLGKPSAKSAPAPAPSGDGGDSDDDFEVEVLPKKNRGAATKAASKIKDEDEVMDDLDEEILPKKSRGPAKPAPKAKEEDDDDSEDIAPKKGRAAAKAKPKPKDEDDDDLDDDEFMEIAKAEAAKSAKSQPSRTSRKITNYTALDDSDSDNGDDLLGDVSKMVKGIGGTTGDSTTDSRQLFSERSRPSSSSSGLKVSSSKPSKLSTDFDADETDYSKLIPQNSPRRSLQVKPKEIKVNDEFDMDDDDDDDDEPVKPAAKAKPVAKGKSATTAAASKPAAAPKPRGRPKKDAAKPAAPAPSLKQTTLSPAAKAYASKQAKATATKKKQLVDDLSDDDIDAMANDILDSPAGKMDVSEEDEPPKRKTAARPARRTAAAKKTYVIEDDSEDDDGGDSGDDFDDEDSD